MRYLALYTSPAGPSVAKTTLKRLSAISSLPKKLNTLVQENNYAQAVQDYKHAQKVLQQYGNQPSFKGIQEDCNVIIEDLKKRLKDDFQQTGKKTAQLTETGELLLQLDEKPSELSKEIIDVIPFFIVTLAFPDSVHLLIS